MRELETKGIAIPAPGGNTWSHDADKRIGLDGHVHLCLWDQHPMEFRAKEQGRIENSRFLTIGPAILRIPDIKFAPDISNKKDCPTYSFEEALEKMDFKVIYERTDWRNPDIQERLKTTKKYEILVPGSVPLEFISGLG